MSADVIRSSFAFRLSSHLYNTNKPSKYYIKYFNNTSSFTFDGKFIVIPFLLLGLHSAIHIHPHQRIHIYRTFWFCIAFSMRISYYKHIETNEMKISREKKGREIIETHMQRTVTPQVYIAFLMHVPLFSEWNKCHNVLEWRQWLLSKMGWLRLENLYTYVIGQEQVCNTIPVWRIAICSVFVCVKWKCQLSILGIDLKENQWMHFFYRSTIISLWIQKLLLMN